MEKLRCMRRNPVQRGLDLELEVVVEHFRHYAHGERGPVLVNETRKAASDPQNLTDSTGSAAHP
jgi:hypothetical protein